MGVMSDLIRRGSPVDALQSASNAVAGMASFPVDAITWALRKGGVDIKNPVGGSDWMADKGLTKEVPQSAYSLAGETVGNLLPFASGPKTAAAVARAGEAAQKGTKAVGNATVDALREGTEGYMSKAGLKPELTTYHGSPHKFDTFDSSKIGTGEGAQAYGHGLYLAEAPDVARTYSADRGYVGAAMAGKPQANEMPNHSGKAIKNTKNPETKSL